MAAWPIWLVPFALIVDNLTYGLAGEQTGSVFGDAAAQALSSALLALARAARGRLAPARASGARGAAATRVAGAGLLVAAGALFLVG